MPKQPLITIDGFDAGMVSDITKQIRNGFNWSAGIDIHENPGLLKVSQKLDAMAQADTTNNITDNIYWMTKYSKNRKIYGLGYGMIYAYSLSQSGKWALIHDDSNTNWSQGMKEYNEEIFYASNSRLGRMHNSNLSGDHDDSVTTITVTDGTNFTTSGTITIGSEVITYTGKSTNDLTGCTRGARGSTAAEHSSNATVYGFDDDFQSLNTDYSWHPMTTYMGKLMIGAGNRIATWDGTTFVGNALVLPVGIRVKSLEVYGDKLVIGTWKGTNLSDNAEATLFTWDGVTTQYEESFTIKEFGIVALANWQNLLIVFAGRYGNIYAFNGVSLQKVVKIIDASHYISPGAISEYKGSLVFPFDHERGTAIYMLEKDNGGKITLNISHILSGGSTDDLRPLAMVQIAPDVFLVSWRNVTESEYGVDTVIPGRRITSGAYWESQEYEMQKGSQKELLKGVEIVANPLQTSNTVVIEYKIDGEATWQSLGTITSANQGQVLKGINKRAKTIQIRLELNTASGNNYSPEIRKINIY